MSQKIYSNEETNAEMHISIYFRGTNMNVKRCVKAARKTLALFGNISPATACDFKHMHAQMVQLTYICLKNFVRDSCLYAFHAMKRCETLEPQYHCYIGE